MTEAVLIALLLLVVMGTVASTGWDVFEMRNREVWWWTSFMILEVIVIPNKYAAALLAVNILGLWQIGRSWYVLRSAIIPMAGLAGIYALVSPLMQLWMVPWILWAMTAIGLYLAGWAALGWAIKRRPFRFLLPAKLKWFGMWGIYEDLDGGLRVLCGQAHPCHLTTLSAFSMAAAAGLVWLGQWWAIPALIVCYLPIHLVYLAGSLEHKAGHPKVGHLGLVGLVIAGVALVSLMTSGILIVTGLVVAAVMTWQVKPWRDADRQVEATWWDSGRLAYWRDVITRCWWTFGWKHRLFGFGTCTWFLKTCMMGDARHKVVYTTAHNEYLSQLIEHGIVGLAVMLAYLGEALWRNLQGSPEQQAVILLGAAWCAVAVVHFPATFYHEYHPPHEKKEVWYGSPPLNVWTLMIALLAEAH